MLSPIEQNKLIGLYLNWFEDEEDFRVSARSVIDFLEENELINEEKVLQLINGRGNKAKGK